MWLPKHAGRVQDDPKGASLQELDNVAYDPEQAERITSMSLRLTELWQGWDDR